MSCPRIPHPTEYRPTIQNIDDSSNTPSKPIAAQAARSSVSTKKPLLGPVLGVCFRILGVSEILWILMLLIWLFP